MRKSIYLSVTRDITFTFQVLSTEGGTLQVKNSIVVTDSIL